MLGKHPAALEIRADIAYRSQEGGLSSTTRSKEENCRKLFGSGGAVQEVMEEHGEGYADEEGHKDRRDRAREGPGGPAVIP